MLLSFSQLAAYSGLVLWLLLLLLLGDSYLSYVLMGMGAVLFIFLHRWFSWQQITHHKRVVVVWLLFLLTLGLSFTQTISVPLSLFDLSFMVSTALTFFSVLAIKEKHLSSQVILLLILLVAATVTAVSIIFQLLPSWAELLPGMNLLQSTYGHNHLAALILLVLPLSWWWAYRGSDSLIGNKWRVVLPLLFTLALLTSYGRVAVVIGLLQLWMVERRFTQERIVRKKHRILFIGLLVMFIVMIAVKSYLSLATILSPSFTCPVPQLEQQLCKPIVQEARPKYWRRAIAIVKDNPLLGSGPGTYSIANQRYLLDPTTATAYAHNAFLQAAANYGILGGLSFTALMGVLFITTLSIARSQSDFTWETAAVWGVAALYIDSLFDFNWNFLGIWTITLVLLALVLKQKQFPQRSLKRREELNHVLLRIGYAIGSGIILVVMGMYLLVEVLIATGQFRRAFSLFPYFHWHRSLFEVSIDLSDNDHHRLLTVYQAHPEAYDWPISRATTEVEKIMYLKKQGELSPSQLHVAPVVQHYLRVGDLDQARQYLDQVLDHWQKVALQTDYEYSYSDRRRMTDLLLELADAFYRQRQTALAGEYYLIARFDDPWILSHYQPINTQVVVSPVEEIDFLASLSQVEVQYLGEYRDQYAHEYESALIAVAQQEQWNEMFNLHVGNAMRLADWTRWRLWEQAGGELLDQAQQYLERQEYQQADRALQEVYQIWMVVEEGLGREEAERLSWDVRHRTALSLVQLGTDLAPTNMEYTWKVYEQAYHLIPWVLSENSQALWFNQYPIEGMTTEELLQHLELTAGKTEGEIGWQTHRQHEIVLELLERLEDYGESEKYQELVRLKEVYSHE